MGISTDDLAGEKNYAFYETLNGVFDLVVDNIEHARHAETPKKCAIRMKMAQCAIECALEIYGDRVAEMQKEKT